MRKSRCALEREAVRFRAAIVEYVRRHPEDRFTTDYINPLRGSFPTGCCKSTSWMLGHHLKLLGVGEEIRYSWGRRGEATHGWLVVDVMIVDVTADQFDDEDRPVIVLAMGRARDIAPGCSSAATPLVLLPTT